MGVTSPGAAPGITVRAGVLEEYRTAPVVRSRALPPTPPGHTLIRTLAAPISRLDLLCASGRAYLGAPALPYVPGVQGVGAVVGPAGDAGGLVWFRTWAGMAPGDGALSEVVAVPDEDVFPVVNDVDPGLLAALGLSAVAALMAMTWTGGLVAGESVLVLGGGGVVGQSAIQLARARGVKRVVALCRSDRSMAAARSLGADCVQMRDDESPAELAARINELSSDPFDLVLDGLWGEPAAAAMLCLRPRGRLVNLGATAGDQAVFASSVVRGGARQILGYSNNDLSREQLLAALDEIGELAAAGRLEVAFERVPLDRLPEAWSAQKTGTASARQVVTFGP
ncbi:MULTISPECIES: zinc-binding alcohol dehydrogenase family protein [Streptomyces]|uniref:Zinc-binding alcohol dehydrogenase family protein n=1 Tax=Streptomyces phaeolivaceus TaxID=2653200 RepID=A0A5P8JX67_9ACTN|nr:zinc-binding alcohol dehydrogenase family protein [Streptomyces phaeolivaceus]QFQ95635.1 zinc-binding alcohol dehydrogenase family protein [Streptomyces phaeolivaceus]